MSDAGQLDRRLRYAGRCRHCDAYTDGSNGIAAAPSVCSVCRVFEERMRARKRTLTAIRLYAGRFGEPPTAREWRTSKAHRVDRPGQWIPTAQVQELFGSWSNAIAAAGFVPRKTGERRRTKSVTSKVAA